MAMALGSGQRLGRHKSGVESQNGERCNDVCFFLQIPLSAHNYWRLHAEG